MALISSTVKRAALISLLVAIAWWVPANGDEVPAQRDYGVAMDGGKFAYFLDRSGSFDEYSETDRNRGDVFAEMEVGLVDVEAGVDTLGPVVDPPEPVRGHEAREAPGALEDVALEMCAPGDRDAIQHIINAQPFLKFILLLIYP